ncbi:MAG: tetratricopeptide repeat protein [Paludibacteraceae bacterium]|nr:tetratricopeptide repeat protein [Paludibacteraceae bacterium]MBP5136778.1 tetratricopeptide repeat protein [Paludibacteraceae bacterium]MBP5742308.1 tetratricopeptide repeat protein [Paludibacteraceae bacterium]
MFSSYKTLVLILSAMLMGSLSSVAVAAKSKNVQNAFGSAKPDSHKHLERKKTYFFTEAVRQKEAGNYDAAIDLLTECYYIDRKDAAVAFEFADIYSKIGDEDRAMKMSHLAATLDQKNIWYKMTLAELYLKNKRPADAVELYEEIENLRPDLEEIDYRLAGLYLQSRQYDKGLQALNRLEKKVGVDENISLEKYHMLQMQGKKKKALAEIEKLSKTFPLNVDYKIFLAMAYLNDSNLVAAERVVDEADKIEPNNEKVITQKLAICSAKGHTDEADAVVLSYVKSDDVEIGEKLKLITDYFSNDTRVDFAEMCFNSLVEQYPDDAMARAYYSTFCLMQRKDTAAEVQLKELVRIDPEYEQGWQDLISIYMHRADSAALSAVSDSALKYLPDSPSLLVIKALSLSLQLKNEESLAMYHKALGAYERNQPDNKAAKADVYMYIGDIYAQNEVPDSAFAYYEKSYELNPFNDLLLNNFAYYLSVYNRDLDRAEQMSGTALKQNPNNVSYLDTYAWIFFRKKEYSMAKIFMQQAMDKGGITNAVCVEHYGDILYMSGEKDEAMEWWKRAAEIGGGSNLLNKKIETGTYVE